MRVVDHTQKHLRTIERIQGMILEPWVKDEKTSSEVRIGHIEYIDMEGDKNIASIYKRIWYKPVPPNNDILEFGRVVYSTPSSAPNLQTKITTNKRDVYFKHFGYILQMILSTESGEDALWVVDADAPPIELDENNKIICIHNIIYGYEEPETTRLTIIYHEIPSFTTREASLIFRPRLFSLDDLGIELFEVHNEENDDIIAELISLGTNLSTSVLLSPIPSYTPPSMTRLTKDILLHLFLR